ncbi:hypothetical protein EHW99_1253 [Erwinia amylovora]|uniref:Uncharacterized protein n=3 Tax=Erwinia amylovora TaxID=552 RepID=A0A831ERE2_ERWAM|nr:hypothetical protein EaACW_2356 [Erwinia amylovora ACW56400]QJQ53959.1 hypothetical protein EHX00_1253 [Erwinia amylovora]CBA21528.1 hypothetical protein predicted by Glimmer/Critica [Erwinia amylovora CFBP1430]CBX81220.1 hypothetical protein predicted by Glimmer/Critica [Erwinia amylovora ATCC BAA-2158]CCO79200.1 hypothetical protein BN432_2413 [Erwinia amylovora Ea356]CCO83005.1 hypothetical protein BN433_2445 [Erwinia amylovora Ea266]CCO86772.1 hypothetical protein BN434_2394 [Erwinia a
MVPQDEDGPVGPLLTLIGAVQAFHAGMLVMLIARKDNHSNCYH